MLREGTNINIGGSCSSTNNWSRACDTCRSAPSVVYCRADSAYLCSACDDRVHAANRVASRHERVWVCEACERAPAAFLCRADAASLCSSCDSDIHSANPLAGRHHRVPILPISGCSSLIREEEQKEGEPERENDHVFEIEGTINNQNYNHGCEMEDEECEGDDEAEAASWLLPHPVRMGGNDESDGFLFCGGDGDGDGDEYLEFVDCDDDNNNNNRFSCLDHDQDQDMLHNYGGDHNQGNNHDSVVPVQMQQCFEFDSSKVGAGFSYNGSLSQSVSLSSMEVGVVPESTLSDVSISHSKAQIGTSEQFPPMPMPSPLLTPMDRVARVLRYKEKKKTRKFEKKIRYESRKAYAETRPRIKGRFAKRTDVEAEVDQMLSSTLMSEAGYGIVPSF
ncbi:hypothetical protein HN51_060294 [Arachis hypogaea]|uniref:zinc finger protein CONSTANS-LIKE 2-like n=1 Tax=Arachis ipaensis TaxID=130454 RepID=UPI0007AF7CBD|nr:zinc finger protein CONSTANS-LIKE 2-like [Arachis ipaensis]XP_025682878.1 zinc finger protein CONSTANS-LIKE 2-like [Arachis hypogaea]